ncbi:hypothetical protein BT63DRAFT_212887 [Microthyrium microscopicum]|uniref:Zn(2)-C6 fungal-type domain-containing protein n=1 Tax=Microthyrium microscopicum TaxID=703497 RepID=A0A6A6UIK6_9PEZI|nr:hypothetical protein BT63DRAFT_212887 [Microthyrium microscopicum]
MSAPEQESQSPPVVIKIRKRRRHQKSRNGCFECKRLRVKCDEAKPACTRCVLALDKCVYPPLQQAPESSKQLKSPEISLASPSSSLLAASPNPPSLIDSLPYFETSLSPRSIPGSTEPHICCSEPTIDWSDTSLYHHYLQHTSRTLTHHPLDRRGLEIGIPTLALRSKTVYHSLLAVSAAHLACKLITKEPPPSVNTVYQVSTAGYYHYNLASQRMSNLLNEPTPAKAEALIASAMLLVPFAAASQQINHWLSSNTDTDTQHVPKLLYTSPRDIIVFMRGIRTTVQAFETAAITTTLPPLSDLDLDDTTDHPPVETAPSPALSHTHVMFPMLTATSREAFSRLHARLESATLSTFPDTDLAACVTAFTILSNIRNTAFSPLSTSPPAPMPIDEHPRLWSHLTPWLSGYLRRGARALDRKHPLTKHFLAFLVLVPQGYLDLVVPLLEQRLVRPAGEFTSPEFRRPEFMREGSWDEAFLAGNTGLVTDLTATQALALDIYAHWSVLMFVTEEESWWIGGLPVVTLSGMVNRYGDDFVGRACGLGGEEWWPGSMLKIAKEIGRFR